jgi:tripartite-type tricarboxylate transporter receptor subunit TctC
VFDGEREAGRFDERPAPSRARYSSIASLQCDLARALGGNHETSVHWIVGAPAGGALDIVAREDSAQ